MSMISEDPKVTMAQDHSDRMWQGKAKWWLIFALCLAVVLLGAGGFETKNDFVAGEGDPAGAALPGISRGTPTILVHPGGLNAL